MLSRTSTNGFENIHWPSRGAADRGSGETPNESTVDARRDLLLTHGLQLPLRGMLGTTALYKFIDGEQLSRRDSLNLSLWLEKTKPQSDLLAGMQKCAPEFLPTVNLLCYENVGTLLTGLQSNGVTFGVSVSQWLDETHAHVLRDAITSGQFCITSFSYPCKRDLEQGGAAITREILSGCIENCKTLKHVGGPPTVLSLLKRSVPEISLDVPFPPTEKQKHELDRVLLLGGVERLSVRSALAVGHQWVAEAVANANATLGPELSVHQVELSNLGQSIDDEYVKNIVSRLFSAEHLTDVTLPSPNWIILPGMGTSDGPLESLEGIWRQPLPALQSLTFSTRDGLEREGRAGVEFDGAMDLLGVILQRNKQSLLLATRGAGLGFALTMMSSDIAELAQCLGEAFAGTSTGRALEAVNKLTATGANEGRKTAERLYLSNRDKAEQNYQKKLRNQASAQPAGSLSQNGSTNPGAIED
jgi:hypothetical protein